MPGQLVVLVRILCKVFWFPFSSWIPITVGLWLRSEHEIGSDGVVVSWVLWFVWLALKRNIDYPAAWLERLDQGS